MRTQLVLIIGIIALVLPSLGLSNDIKYILIRALGVSLVILYFYIRFRRRKDINTKEKTFIQNI